VNNLEGCDYLIEHRTELLLLHFNNDIEAVINNLSGNAAHYLINHKVYSPKCQVVSKVLIEKVEDIILGEE